MKIQHTLFAAPIIFGLWLMPVASQAKVATLDSITCETDVTNITPADEFDPDERSTENYQVFWYYTTVGEDCEMNVSFDEMPLMVFVSGGAMTAESNWTLNSEAKTGQVLFTSRAIQQVDAEVNNNFADGDTLTTVAFIWEPEDPDQGPDEQVAGAWVATDFQEYTLIVNDSRMGAQVRGDEGDAGQFAMYMPETAVQSIDETITDVAEEMSVYLGDEEQTDSAIQAVDDGGAYLNFNAELDAANAVDSDEDGNSQAQQYALQAASAVSVRVTAGPAGDGAQQVSIIKKNTMTAKKVKQHKATLRWRAVAGAATYSVQLRKCKIDTGCDKAKHFQKEKNYRTIQQLETNRRVVKKLQSGTAYQWRVRACNEAGCAAFSPWKKFGTNE